MREIFELYPLYAAKFYSPKISLETSLKVVHFWRANYG